MNLATIPAVALVVLAVPALARAEPGAADATGSSVRVVLAASRAPSHLGPVAPLERTRASLVARPTVRQTRPDSLRNGLLIGALAGGAYGVVVARLLHEELGGASGVAGVIATTTATGAAIGALVDALR
jgi:hypothetical protein